MSLLPAEVQGALSQLLQALSSPDNAVRSRAEEQLTNDWQTNRPDVLMMGLVEHAQGAQDPAVCGRPLVETLYANKFSDTYISSCYL